MNAIPLDISYHRQKSSTARIRNGGIHLRISSLVSRREQQRHIDELLASMKKQWFRTHRQMKIKLSFSKAFETGELRLSTGTSYQMRIKKAERSGYKISILGTTLLVLQAIEEIFDEEKAENVLWKFLMKDQLPLLKRRLDELSEGWIEERCSRVRLRTTMSRWGSCDKKSRVIMLSAKLLLVEAKLLDYVCVHELAHLKYGDHSDLFWDLVSQKMPDWKIQRKRLRRYE